MQTWDGSTVWFSRQEHAQTLIGFDYGAGTIQLSDPKSGNYRTFSMALFEQRFAQFHSTAVVVGRQSVVYQGQSGTSVDTTAVRGADDQLWVASPGGGFASYGGALAAAPAVVRNVDGVRLYIALGQDHRLWIRNDSQGWRPLSGDGSQYCIDSPAAAVNGADFAVACEGRDGSLYVAHAALVPGAVPTIGGMSYLAGHLTGGPGAGVAAGQITYLVNGTDGHVWARTEASAWTQTPWSCIGHPALARNAASGLVAFTCHGGDDAVWFAMAHDALPTGAASPLYGRVDDGVGIAATADGGFEVGVEGVNFELFYNRIGAAGAVGGWTAMGGVAINGAATT